MSVELISVLIAVLAIRSSAVRADPDQQSRRCGEDDGPDGGAAARRHWGSFQSAWRGWSIARPTLGAAARRIARKRITGRAVAS